MKAYVIENGRELGPFTPTQLREMAANQRLLPDSIIRLSDSDQKVRARQLKGLFASTSTNPQPTTTTPEPPSPQPVEEARSVAPTPPMPGSVPPPVPDVSLPPVSEDQTGQPNAGPEVAPAAPDITIPPGIGTPTSASEPNRATLWPNPIATRRSSDTPTPLRDTPRRPTDGHVIPGQDPCRCPSRRRSF